MGDTIPTMIHRYLLISLIISSGLAFLDNTLPLHLFTNLQRGPESSSVEPTVRRVPPYFSYKLERKYVVGVGGSINLTCVAVGYPMPRVFWKKSDQEVLDDPSTSPVGKNVLTLSNVEQTENFTCVAVSALGNIEATTTVIAKPLPPAPKDVQVIAVTSESVTLRWEPPITDLPISKYIVKYRQKSGLTTTSSSSSSTPSPTDSVAFGYAESRTARGKTLETLETNIVIDGLQPFQLYEFTVQTMSEVGPGVTSLPTEAQTAEDVPSSPPNYAQARSLNRDAILVKWSASDRPNGQILGYRVRYTSADPELSLDQWKKHETKADELMATLYELEPDTKYFIRVTARNSKGESPVSNLVTVSTKQGIPGQPTRLKASALDSRRIQLTWDKPLFSTPITGYTIRYNTSDGEKELTLTPPLEKHVVSGLLPDRFYAFRVAAISARGEGEFTEPVSEKTIASIPLAAPIVTDLTSPTSKSLRINWSAPNATQQNGELVAYKLTFRVVTSNYSASILTSSSDEYDDGEEDDVDEAKMLSDDVIVGANVTSYVIENLTPWTTYEVVVSAATDDGFGPESSPKRMQTLEDGGSSDEDVYLGGFGVVLWDLKFRNSLDR
ncbi:unnamed protein product [Caenorhabditis auriculariae]|uniref:protein-tyrosine-phosphatase n=1 Tax=Caenorhabditis auriculariae TaxID=2777116 RepID=A0A8S1HMY9_9PELO|nr:unnamed protein product [Caenorhabditis auriculariae]